MGRECYHVGPGFARPFSQRPYGTGGRAALQREGDWQDVPSHHIPLGHASMLVHVRKQLPQLSPIQPFPQLVARGAPHAFQRSCSGVLQEVPFGQSSSLTHAVSPAAIGTGFGSGRHGAAETTALGAGAGVGVAAMGDIVRGHPAAAAARIRTAASSEERARIRDYRFDQSGCGGGSGHAERSAIASFASRGVSASPPSARRVPAACSALCQPQ